MYTKAVIHQIEIAVQSLINIIDQLKEEELDLRPSPDKRSLRELLSHISVLCKADYFIMNEASKEDMMLFYKENNPQTLAEIRFQLNDSFQFLEEKIAHYDPHDLMETTTSYWGVQYTRCEWLVQIVAHFYHHRGQLQILIDEHMGNVKVPLFE